MHSTGGRIVVNPTFEDWVYEDEEKQSIPTPLKRQITYHVEEEIGHTKPYDDPWKQQGQPSYDYGKVVTTTRSNRALSTLVALLLVVSIAALVLNLLMFFGKINYKCGCSEDQIGKCLGFPHIGKLVLGRLFKRCFYPW